MSIINEALDPDMIYSDIEGINGDEVFEEEKIASAIPNYTEIGNGLKIVDRLTSVNYSNRSNPKKYLVVHYTAGTVDNGTAAKANAMYFKDVNRNASAHFFVDCSSLIYRAVSEDLVAWHCGGGSYYHPTCRNSNSIGVEICSYKEGNTYKFKQQTYNNALTLCKYIVNKYNIPKDNVIMHWHTTHKVCPAPFITNNQPNNEWYKFRDSIYSDTVNTTTKTVTYDVTPLKTTGEVIGVGTSTLNLRKEPILTGEILGGYKLGDKVNIIGVYGQYKDWYKLDNNGYVSSKYIRLSHWADIFRDNLLTKGIIIDKDQWSEYTNVLTRGLAAKLISNIYGGEDTTIKYKHYAVAAVNNLNKHGIIKDKTQWTEKTLDSPISIALFLALIDNATGGTIDKYINRNTDHWGRNHLDSLCDKEIIDTPESWSNFEGQVTYSSTLAIISKSLSKIK